jgi:hypothetical protein
MARATNSISATFGARGRDPPDPRRKAGNPGRHRPGGGGQLPQPELRRRMLAPGGLGPCLLCLLRHHPHHGHQGGDAGHVRPARGPADALGRGDLHLARGVGLAPGADGSDRRLPRPRFGGKPPPRPLLPVLPLGVHCDDFAPDPEAGQALRRRLGIAEGDIACAIIARLVPHEKFDPLPLYLALAEAQRQAGRRFHLLLCGQFRDDYGRKVFAEGARALMPEVGCHMLDGADAGRTQGHALGGARCSCSRSTTCRKPSALRRSRRWPRVCR